MSRRPRTQYMRVTRNGESPLLCGTWAAGPESRKEEIGHVVFGKVSSESPSTGTLELSSYDFKEDLLSNSIQDVKEDDRPHSMVAHPGGDGVVCSFSNSSKLFELDIVGQSKLKASSRGLIALQGIGTQVSLVFSPDGSRVAAGGKDGHLRVFEWPSLNVLLDLPEGCKFLSCLDISLDGAFLAAIPDGGSYCRVWDIEKSTIITTIQSANKSEVFGSCRFSRDGAKPFLFVTMSKGGKGTIGVWDIETWNKVGVKAFTKDLITSFAISQDGKWLACGSVGGDIHVIEVKKMQTFEQVKDAHLSAVTVLEFSPNGRAILSMSSDSTARVTRLNKPADWKEWQIYLLLISMILGSAVLFYIFFEYSDSFWKFPLGRNQPARPPPEAIYWGNP